MHITASDPAASGQIANRTVAIRIGTAAVLIAAGAAVWGITAGGSAPADAPAHVVVFGGGGGGPAQFR